MRIQGLEAAEKGAQDRRHGQMFLEPALTQFLGPRMGLCPEKERAKALKAWRRADLRHFLRPEKGGDQAQVGADAEEQGSKDRRTHDDIGHRQSPPTGLSRDAAHMEEETDHAIQQRRSRGPAQDSSRGPCIKEARNSCDRHRAA